MHKLYILIILLSISTVVSSWAQPINDDCSGAIELEDLNSACNIYMLSNATIDTNLEQTCAPNLLPDSWFRFIAQGKSLEINVTVMSDAYITLYEVDQLHPCVDTLFDEVECGFNNLNVTNELKLGYEYLVRIEFTHSNQNINYQVCINNPPPTTAPFNDAACQADWIYPGDSLWVGGHNFHTTPDRLNSRCHNNSRSSVWYKFLINPGYTQVRVIMDAKFNGPYSVQLVEFNNNNCRFNANQRGDTTYCMVDSSSTLDSLLFTNLKRDIVYYLQIASADTSTGVFRFILDELPDPEGCGVHDECLDAHRIELVGGGSQQCVEGCTRTGDPGPQTVPGACNFFSGASSWEVFTPSPGVDRIALSVSSDELIDLQVAVFSGDTCSQLTPITCKFGSGGVNNITFNRTSLDSNIYIVISDRQDREGYYELCIEEMISQDNCNLHSSLKVTNTSFGSPLNGPYQSGEVLTFCYKVEVWQKVNCNLIQGIVPLITQGFDPTSFLASGRPVNITKPIKSNVPGFWQWYAYGAVDYNFNNPLGGLQAGDPMPAGWYYVNDLDATVNPDFSRGDGLHCNYEANSEWEVCFELKVQSPSNCMQGSFPVRLTMKTFSDSEVGTNLMPGCGLDLGSNFLSTAVCCNGPQVADAQISVCDGGFIDHNLNPNADSNVAYSWVVQAPSGVTGASDGSGEIIHQQLFNSNPNAVTVQYIVSAINTEEDCVGAPATITVNLQPSLIVNAGPDIDGCQGQMVRLGGSPTASGGSGNFVYIWSGGIPSQANPFITLSQNSTITLTVRDSRGCTNTDEVNVTVSPAAFDSTYVELCFGETFNFAGDIITESGHYTKSFVQPSACDSVAVVEAVVFTEITLFSRTVEPDDGSGNGSITVSAQGGRAPYTYNWSHGGVGPNQNNLSHGRYTLTITDSKDCSETFIIDVPLGTATTSIDADQQILLIPNPINQNAPIQIVNKSQESINRISVYDLQGRLLVVSPMNLKPLTNGQLVLPLHAGVYLIQLTGSNIQMTTRLMVQ